MDAEQFRAFLQAMQGILQQSVATQNPVQKKEKRTIVEKGFNRLEKFSRGEQEFVDWAYDFKTIIGTQCYQLKILLDAVEKEKVVSNADALYTKFREQMVKVEEVADIVKLNFELYDVLNVLTEGTPRRWSRGSRRGTACRRGSSSTSTSTGRRWPRR